MKYTIKYVLTMVTLLLATTGAWADSTVTITKQINGDTNDDAGTVNSSVADGICTLTVTPADGNYATSDNITAYATVTGEMAQSRGRAPGINEGTITVTATDSNADPSGETTYTFTMPTDGSNVEVTVDFQYRTNISDAEVTLAESSMIYTGNELKPAVTSVVLDGTISSDNYDVTYENNINATTENSPAIVTVTGKRTYTGSATATFVIAKATIAATAENVTATYDGQGYGITVNVTAPATGATITYGESSDVIDKTTSPTQTAVGTKTVYYKVTADNYETLTGSATVTISKADAAITKAPSANEDMVYTGSEQTLIKAGEATGGTMQYSTDGETFSATLPAGTNAGDYTIYYKVAGDKNHNDVMAETTIQVNIASKALTSSMVSLGSESVIYNGSAQEPTVTVTDGETTLSAGTDYVVTYSDNTEIGTAKATITGSGNYTGTIELTFTILENVSGELNTAFGENHKYCTFVPRQALTIPDGVKAYAVTGIDLTSRTVTISEVNYLVAGVPLLLEKTGNEIGSSKLYDGEKSDVTTILKSSGESGKSVGTNESCYVLYNDEYVKVTSGTTIAANKYYLQQTTNPAGAPRRLFINKGTTSINEIISMKCDGQSEEKWYDLNGRRALSPVKGQLYIVNGKKVVYNK